MAFQNPKQHLHRLTLCHSIPENVLFKCARAQTLLAKGILRAHAVQVHAN